MTAHNRSAAGGPDPALIAEYVVDHEVLGRHPGKVHRYTVTGYWGEVPDQIKALLGVEDGYCVDYWRGEATTWTIERRGKFVGGWGGDYAGVRPVASAQSDGKAAP